MREIVWILASKRLTFGRSPIFSFEHREPSDWRPVNSLERELAGTIGNRWLEPAAEMTAVLAALPAFGRRRDL